ncbi:MAG: tetratricopeptide repeat protein, partial [Thermoplasmata archaeon]|nr:tetratricopeptide repeat protein [Thermoplasmata archaeon]
MDELAFRQPELVGRDNELGMLKKALTDASSEKGSTIFVSGEPGIGKTRLVEEFRKHAESAGVRILSGAAMSGSTHPFQIFSKALEGISFEPLFEESEYTSFAEIFAVNSAGLLLGKASSEEGGLDADIFAGMLSAVQDFVRDSFGQGGEKAGLGRLEYGDMKILIEHGHYMFLTAVFSGAEHPDMKNTLKQTLQKVEESHGQLIEKWTGNLSDIKPVQDEIEKLSGARFLVRKDLEGVKLENERLKIADRVLETLARLSGEKPLVMFLEDLHWADESSLFVLNYLARNIRKARVLLLGTLRQRESDVLQKAIENMKNEEIMNEMALENLDFKNTVSFIDRTYSPNDFSGTLAERLYEQSKGNPLFVTEMLKGMLADGNIVKADGRYSLVSESYNVPTTVEEVINGRLEFLDPDSMAMVEYASCIGQKFDVSLAASSRLTKDPDASLEKLLASGILLRKNGAIEFSHAVFQNVIYDSIGERWKNGHHRNLGEYFEINYADRLDEVIYDLAWHFSRTKEYQKCSDYCIGAGEKAEDSFAVEQALEFYNWALAALSKLDITEAKDRSLNISERAGDLRSLMGKYDEAIGNFMTVKEKADDKEIKARMLRKVGEVRTSKGEFEGSLEVLAEAKELAEVDTAEYGRIIFAEGYSYLRKGDYDKAMSLSSEAVNIAEKAGTDKKDIGKALRAIGMIYHSKGDYDTALQYFEKSLAVMEEIGEEYGIASVLNNIGVVYKIKGELDKALEFYERSLEIKERIGDKQGVAMSLGNIGNVHWNRGDMERALESHERSLEIKEKVGDEHGMSTTLNNLGSVYQAKGEWDRAI